MESETIQCPFVYANGRRCSGGVYRARAYGRMFRLWCSDKGDHCGIKSDSVSKMRMEFYPHDLERHGIYEQVLDLCENIERPADWDAPSLRDQTFDCRPLGQQQAEALNLRVQQLWPEKWEATRHMSRTAQVKHRKRLREMVVEIDKKNARNARLASIA